MLPTKQLLMVIVLVSPHTSLGADYSACYPNGTIRLPPKERFLKEEPGYIQCSPPGMTDVTWTITPDSPEGEITVTHRVPAFNVEYEVELIVNTAYYETDCGDAEKLSRDKEHVHSKRTSQNVSESTCGTPTGSPDNVTVSSHNISFVFTGCYQVVVIGGSNKIEYYRSPTKYLVTEYKKHLFDDTDEKTGIVLLPDHRSPIRSLDVQIGKDMWLVPITLEITLEFLILPNETRKTWYIDLHTDKKITTCVTEEASSLKTDYKLDCKTDYKSIYSNELVTCTLTGLGVGDYFIKMYIDNDNRCGQNTLWTAHINNECSWQHKFKVTEVPADQPVNISRTVKESNSLLIALVSVAGMVLLVAIAALLFHWQCRLRLLQRTPRDDNDSSNVSDLPKVSRILLVYARDCPQFMTLMTSFRRLVHIKTSCEVQDWHDTALWNIIALNACEWLRCQLASPVVRIIVVATRCASIRQAAHHGNTALRYKVPDSHDQLFTAAMQVLCNDTSVDLYRRVFVVRFDECSDDGDLSVYLNKLTRFVLPQHMDQLFGQIDSCVMSKPVPSLIETNQLKVVKKNHEDLINFSKTNTNYLQDLIVIQISQPQ